MIFVTVCIGEERRSDLMHLLNDLRNLDYNCFILTNLDLELDRFQFENAIVKKTNRKNWTDYQRFEIIKSSLEETNEKYIYWLDCDSRFVNFRNEKFDKEKFEATLDKFDFDMMCPFFLESVKNQLGEPEENENKSIRNFKFGYDSVNCYFKNINPNYEKDLELSSPLETCILFKRSEKLINYMDELINFSMILEKEDIKNKREHLACSCGFAMRMLQGTFDIKIIDSPVVHHFFKGNFLKEVFPFNFKIDKNMRILDGSFL
jgi:hypothetical protein